MSQIVFPLLNLKLNISSVAFKIANISIYWYAIIIVSAIIVGTIICKKRDGLYGIKYEDVLELLIWILPISIICARIYYVLFSLDEYVQNPVKVFDFRNGGLAIYGAIIGGILTTVIYAKIKKINFLDLADYIIPTVALGQAIGRWGNFMNMEAYGKVTAMPWRMGIYSSGTYIEVHPTFLYSSIANLIIFVVLLKMKNKRKYKGQILCAYLLMYSFIRTFIEELRTDSLMIGTIKISQLLSVIIFIIVVYYVSPHLKKLYKIKV